MIAFILIGGAIAVIAWGLALGIAWVMAYG